MPSTSWRPSVLTPMASTTATETTRPCSRTLTSVASSQRYGQSPARGRFMNEVPRWSISSHSRETWLLETPLIPIALTSSSTERVEMPWI